MSGAVATAPRIRARSLALEEIGPRLIVFGTLAAFCLAHYAALVRPSGASPPRVAGSYVQRSSTISPASFFTTS